MPINLEQISHSLNYGDLPEVWRVPEDDRFSAGKTLYDYQTDALKNAARALYLYYDNEHDWSLNESLSANDTRKRYFYGLYGDADFPRIQKYKSRADRNNGKQDPVFRILADYIPPMGEEIPYRFLINRLCFWMATGSGKTLVMVKLIAYLHSLIRHGEIPPHPMLILAPSDHLLGQIRRTVAEFNQTGLHIELVPLRDSHRPRQGKLGDTVIVYYHRSDTLADVQKDKLTDYRNYENNGRWYVLLDEAHKGGKEDSKRQAYYAVMARQGFLFNFSATFTETEDITTTVKKYNLEDFIKKGHGKNICLNESEYSAFQTRDQEINADERRQIVLQSILTLALVSRQVNALREETRLPVYHRPLMLTLVHSVNTVQNDLLAFFQTLRDIASGDIDKALFKRTQDKLIDECKDAKLLFSETDNGRTLIQANDIRKMTMAVLREQVFNSKTKGALQVVRGNDKKELALQIKSAAAPFALIRIGDTTKWRKDILAGYEETTALQEKSFFDDLEKSDITILMGSRSFFESWDSNRPNVINFINIGSRDATKFVVQSVGRGVRIEPLPGKRRRVAFLPDAGSDEKQKTLQAKKDRCTLPETLFLFATNRKAIQAVLEGIQNERKSEMFAVTGFEPAPLPLLKNNKPLPLLIPAYREDAAGKTRHPFALSQETRDRFQRWMKQTSNSLFAVRDGLAPAQIAALHGVALNQGETEILPGKHYGMLDFLQKRLLAHFAEPTKESGGVREIDEQEDIVHFRQVRAHSSYVRELEEKISRVKQGKSSLTKKQLAGQLFKDEITEEQFDLLSQGQDEATFKELTIKKILGHYYLPVVVGDEKADYIRHIIKVKSEVKFLDQLETWLESHTPAWDGWLFSKIDEAADAVYIPYRDKSKNEWREFFPDFIFWMCKGNEYRIVFVDPKGDAHTDSLHKIDAYKKLFLENNKARRFQHGQYTVSVHLLYYNPAASPPAQYKEFWIADIAPVFAG